MGMVAKVQIDAGEDTVFTEDAVAALVGQECKVDFMGRPTIGHVTQATPIRGDDGSIIAASLLVQVT